MVLGRQVEAAEEVEEEELPRAPVQAPVHTRALGHLIVLSLPHSWLVGRMFKPSSITSLLDPPGNNPRFPPLSPTPDHHPSSSFSISSINSPSIKCISFSSEACKGIFQYQEMVSDEGSAPHTHKRRSRKPPFPSSGPLQRKELAEGVVVGEAGRSPVQVLVR